MRADSFASRQGVVAKTESSEYGFFANNGQPSFAVHLNGRYVEPRAPESILRPGQWHHLAGVFDGSQVRLYVDGALVASAEGEGPRTTNELPLVIGGDVNRSGSATSTLNGLLDGVRLSRGARYVGERFQPARRHVTDADTVLLLAMDGSLGPWIFDTSPSGRRLTIRGEGEVAAAGR